MHNNHVSVVNLPSAAPNFIPFNHDADKAPPIRRGGCSDDYIPFAAKTKTYPGFTCPRTKRKRDECNGITVTNPQGPATNVSSSKSSNAPTISSNSCGQDKNGDRIKNGENRTQWCPSKKENLGGPSESKSQSEESEVVIPEAPWKSPRKTYVKGIMGLHEEIEDFYEWMTPTDSEHQIRCGLIQRLRQMISKEWKFARVDVFGSFKTGLYLPSSDIDLVLVGHWNELPLRTIERLLIEKNLAEPDSLKVLDKAAVPIVKFTDRTSKIKVDISFNMSNGLRAAELIKHFRKMFPALSKLTYVLKQFLQMRDLNEVFTGGLSSYALILLVVHFLQRHPRRDAGGHNANLGVLLIEFFEHYGRNFNFMKNAIRVRDGGSLVLKDQIQRQMANGHQTALICIEDPLDPSNDVGRSSYGAMMAKQAFEKAYLDLTNLVRQNEIQPEKSILSQVVRVSQDLCQYRDWIRSLTSNGQFPNPLLLDPNHMTMCEFSKRPFQNSIVLLQDIEPKELSEHHGDTTKTDCHSGDQAKREEKSSEEVNDNLSSVSTGSSTSMRTSSPRSTESESDGLPSAGSSGSSSMSVSPATSEVGGATINKPALQDCSQTLSGLSTGKISQNKKSSEPGFKNSNSSLASGGSSKAKNVYRQPKSAKETKDSALVRADMDLNWRSHGPIEKPRADRADQDTNWRHHGSAQNSTTVALNGNSDCEKDPKSYWRYPASKRDKKSNTCEAENVSCTTKEIEDRSVNTNTDNNILSAKDRLTAGLFCNNRNNQNSKDSNGNQENDNFKTKKPRKNKNSKNKRNSSARNSPVDYSCSQDEEKIRFSCKPGLCKPHR